MGYTHYFKLRENASIDDYRWNDAVELGKACMKASGVSIRGGDGTGKPIINGKKVCFNGDREKNEHYETFYIEREGMYAHGFCKTARLPYDIVVCCFLLAFKYVFNKDFEYSSDGVTRSDMRNKKLRKQWAEELPNWTPKVEKEWNEAYKLFNKVRKELYPETA